LHSAERTGDGVLTFEARVARVDEMNGYASRDQGDKD
jgi:hypothetical protein